MPDTDKINATLRTMKVEEKENGSATNVTLVTADNLKDLPSYRALPEHARNTVDRRLRRLGEDAAAVVLEDGQGNFRQMYMGLVTPYDAAAKQWIHHRYAGDPGQDRPQPGLVLVEGADYFPDREFQPNPAMMFDPAPDQGELIFPRSLRTFSTWGENGFPMLPPPVIPLASSPEGLILTEAGAKECVRRSLANESHMCTVLFTLRGEESKDTHWVSSPWNAEEVRQRYYSTLSYPTLARETREDLDRRLDQAGPHDRIIMVFDADAQGKRRSPPRHFFFGKMVDAKGTLEITEHLNLSSAGKKPACVEAYVPPIVQEYLVDIPQAQKFYDAHVKKDPVAKARAQAMDRKHVPKPRPEEEEVQVVASIPGLPGGVRHV